MPGAPIHCLGFMQKLRRNKHKVSVTLPTITIAIRNHLLQYTLVRLLH